MGMNPYELLIQGGILMWPILFCSIIALAIVVERVIALRRADIDAREFMDTMRQVLRQNRLQEAVEICDETDAPVARIVKAGILKHNRSKEEIREAIENAGHFEIPRLERYLSGLATCATVAPMLGLLGTVIGMVGVDGSSTVGAGHSPSTHPANPNMARNARTARISPRLVSFMAFPTIPIPS